MKQQRKNKRRPGKRYEIKPGESHHIQVKIPYELALRFEEARVLYSKRIGGLVSRQTILVELMAGWIEYETSGVPVQVDSTKTIKDIDLTGFVNEDKPW